MDDNLKGTSLEISLRDNTKGTYFVNTGKIVNNISSVLLLGTRFASFRDLASAQRDAFNLGRLATSLIHSTHFDLISTPVLSYRDNLIVVTDIRAPELRFLTKYICDLSEQKTTYAAGDDSFILSPDNSRKLKNSPNTFVIPKNIFEKWSVDPYAHENVRLELITNLFQGNKPEIDAYFNFIGKYYKKEISNEEGFGIPDLLGFYYSEFEGLRFLRSNSLNDNFFLDFSCSPKLNKNANILSVSNLVDYNAPVSKQEENLVFPDLEVADLYKGTKKLLDKHSIDNIDLLDAIDKLYGQNNY